MLSVLRLHPRRILTILDEIDAESPSYSLSRPAALRRVFAILALRSRSIWGGFFVHAGVAVGMDVASMLRQDRIPDVFWPF